MLAAKTPREKPSVELWTRLAWGVGLLGAGWVVLLGSRLPGDVPIVAYVFGPALLTLVALAVLVSGAFVSLKRRGRALRPRLIGFGLCAAVIGGVNMPFPFPTRHDGHPSSTLFELPIPADEEWVVAWGGVQPEGNLFAKAAADRRYALALVKLGPDGKSWSTAPASTRRLGDNLAFDALVGSPAAGRVVRAVDGRADRGVGEFGAQSGDGLGGEAFGNHVVVAVSEDEFLFVTHLRSGSVAVAVGDEVVAGQELGRVGHSGRDPFLDEPHIAIHLQDTPEPFWGQAIPWFFAGYESGGAPVERALPNGGIDAAGSFLGERVQRSPD